MTDNQLELPITKGGGISPLSGPTTKTAAYPLKLLTLKRLAFNADGIPGVLLDENVPFCLTLENSKLHIPKGEFAVKRSFYQKGNYETFEIIVSGRERILFHKGNLQEDSLGCVLLGEEFEPIANKQGTLCNGIAASGRAFAEFMQRLKGIDECKLIILET